MRISKGGNTFCYPEHIDREMRQLFQKLAKARYHERLDARTFAGKAAHVLAELNAIHPFREGNGRTQLSFLVALAERAGHPLPLDELDPKAMIEASIASFDGNEKPLGDLIERSIPYPR